MSPANPSAAKSSAKPWPTAPVQAAAAVDPIILQIVEGTLNSIEAEIEYAIERTARSPMIREAHDYRVGLFDRYCRKLTGRSYSAMPNAVVRDFPPETMRPGDVFLMNDTYLTEGSIGHLPDLCSTVPVFHEGEVVAYIQAFGHHDDIGGSGAGLDAGHRGDRVRGRSRDPADETLQRRRAQRGCLIPSSSATPGCRRCCRRSRQRDAGLHHGCAAHGRAVRALRPRLRSRPRFQAILDKCRDIYRNELLAKIADGEYVWEDYVEHDGVTDPKLHKLVMKMIKKGGRITLDFNGTDPQSTGPINWPADYADGAFLIKWIAPILRNLADTPERAAEIHVNEGVREVFDMMFPPKGTPDHAGMAGGNQRRARSCCCAFSACSPAWWRRRSTAACRPTRKPSVTPGSTAPTATGKSFLSREVLGGGSGGRYYADGNDAIHIVPDSRNQPAEFTETRFPLLGRKTRAPTPIRGGAGLRRGGLGYEKHYRALVDCRTIVHRRPRAARLLRPQWRQGRRAILRHRRSRRRSPRSRRSGRWRAGARRTGRPRGHHRRRRLGRPANAASRTRCCRT